MKPGTFLPLDRRRALAWLGVAALPAAATAQSRYPDKPITLLVPFGPGGIADLTARAVAEVMSQRLGQPIEVDNRPSAGSIVASQAVAAARPDGYTLLLMSNGNAVSVGLFKKLPYDTLKAFAPISTLGYFDLGLYTPAHSRHATLKDVVAYAKANPGKLNVGTISAGSTQHLAAKLFETVAGLEVLLVPYKGSPAVLTALRAGENRPRIRDRRADAAAGSGRSGEGARGLVGQAQPGAAGRAHGGGGWRGRLRRRVVECIGGTGRHAGRRHRDAEPGRP